MVNTKNQLIAHSSRIKSKNKVLVVGHGLSLSAMLSEGCKENGTWG
jgi:hypothetical protein